MEEEVGAMQVEFNGDPGTPIRYEDIVLGRDVVFLVWERHYDEEVRSMGAPEVGTYNYTGFLRSRDGVHFEMTYFSNVVADGHLPALKGRILLDGGVNTQPMMLDEDMKFWKTGELYIMHSPGNTEDVDDRAGERLTIELDSIIDHKMTHGTLDGKHYDRGLALYLKCKSAYLAPSTPAWHRQQRVLRAFEDEFLKYPRD